MIKEKPIKRDVFHSFLVENADYDGFFEMPVIRTSHQLPDKVVTFSKSRKKVAS